MQSVGGMILLLNELSFPKPFNEDLSYVNF